MSIDLVGLMCSLVGDLNVLSNDNLVGKLPISDQYMPPLIPDILHMLVHLGIRTRRVYGPPSVVSFVSVVKHCYQFAVSRSLAHSSDLVWLARAPRRGL